MFKNCTNYRESILLEGLVKIILKFFSLFFPYYPYSNFHVNATSLAPKENKMEDPSVSASPNPRKRNLFPKEEPVSSDPEETAGSGSLPKRKQSFPKEEPASDPKEAGNRSVSKKKRTFYSRTSQSAVELKKLLTVPRKNSKH